MNKPSLFVLTLLILLLTTCGGSSQLQPASASSNILSIETQLILGTPKLEETDQALTSEQAKELLPMWQVYQDISNSSTAAQEEVDGLIEQIQETINTEQLQAITEMNLTQQDVFAALQAQNITASSGGQGSNSSSVGFGPPDGGFPGGGPPDAGMGGGAPPDGGMGDMTGMGGTGLSTSADQSQETEAGSSQGRSAGVPTVLIDALIQYLEQIARS